MISASMTSKAVTSVRCFCVQNRYRAAARMMPKARYSPFTRDSLTANSDHGQPRNEARGLFARRRRAIPIPIACIRDNYGPESVISRVEPAAEIT